MKHIIAFAGSSSKQSINKQLVTYTSGLVENTNATILDLNDFDVPLFSVDLEKSMNGQPENAHKLLNSIQSADGVIISLAEHNGAYASVFKNLLDWMSRINGKIFAGKPMLLMSASPGGRGGASVFAMAKDRFPRHEADIVAGFSLPMFNDNFSDGKIINIEMDALLKQEVETFKKSL